MDRARAARLERELAGKDVGSWTIERLINNGGTAAVFVGTNGVAQVAVKIFDPELVERYGEDVQRERIARELELVGVHHPNLVEIVGGGRCEATGLDFVAMKFYPWRTLKESLQDFPRDRIADSITRRCEWGSHLPLAALDRGELVHESLPRWCR